MGVVTNPNFNGGGCSSLGPAAGCSSGNRWFTGNGAPSDALGNNDDFYLDLDNSYVYEKIGGTWIFQSVLQGAAESDDQFNAPAGENILAGQPVYVNVSGQLMLARADGVPQCRIAGFALADIDSGFAGIIISDGKLVLTDWTAVVGAASLIVGAEYFLSTGTFGQIINSASLPSADTQGLYIVQIGRAIKSDTLDIKIEAHPIKL